MGTLLKIHDKFELWKPYQGFPEKWFQLSVPKGHQHYIRKPHKKWFKSGFVRAATSAVLELVPETKKENLEFELPLYDPSKGIVLDLAVVEVDLLDLLLHSKFPEAGLSVCSIDPCPRMIWPNNYGVWVYEFEAMDLLDCLDTTWSGTVVYIDEQMKKNLDRPHGRVNRSVKFHQAKLIKVIHAESKSLLICNDGVTIQASVVLDATGFARSLVQYDKPYNHGYQASVVFRRVF